MKQANILNKTTEKRKGLKTYINYIIEKKTKTI